MSQLFPDAAPGFDNPLGMLRACHQRILRQCDTLRKLAAHLKTAGADTDARKAAEQVLRYFTVAGKHHHEDEERDIFPRLNRVSLKMADTIHALKTDHVEMARLWSELEPKLRRPDAIEDLDAFAALVEDFNAIYRRHIEREDTEFLVQAQHILSSKQLQEIGKAMAERRGVQPDGTPLPQARQQG